MSTKINVVEFWFTWVWSPSPESAARLDCLSDVTRRHLRSAAGWSAGAPLSAFDALFEPWNAHSWKHWSNHNYELKLCTHPSPAFEMARWAGNSSRVTRKLFHGLHGFVKSHRVRTSSFNFSIFFVFLSCQLFTSSEFETALRDSQTFWTSTRVSFSVKTNTISDSNSALRNSRSMRGIDTISGLRFASTSPFCAALTS